MDVWMYGCIGISFKLSVSMVALGVISMGERTLAVLILTRCMIHVVACGWVT